MEMHVAAFCFCRLVAVSLFLATFFLLRFHFLSFFAFVFFIFISFLPFVIDVGSAVALAFFLCSCCCLLHFDSFVDCEPCARTIATNVRHRCA